MDRNRDTQKELGRQTKRGRETGAETEGDGKRERIARSQRQRDRGTVRRDREGWRQNNRQGLWPTEKTQKQGCRRRREHSGNFQKWKPLIFSSKMEALRKFDRTGLEIDKEIKTQKWMPKKTPTIGKLKGPRSVHRQMRNPSCNCITNRKKSTLCAGTNWLLIFIA